MKILSLTQGTPEWHEHRRTSLGATTASILAGVNKWRKPIDLYEEMVDGKVVPLNDAMLKGMALEEEARAWAEKELECQLFPITAQSTDLKFMHASMDGLSLDGSVGVEIKCSKKTYDDCVKGIIPIYYYFQMQQQMFVCHLDFMYYVCYWEGKGVILKVERDSEMVTAIVDRATRFYCDHILPKIPPTSDNVKKETLNELDDDSRKSVLLNLANREEIVNKIKHLEKLKEYLDEQIFAEVKESCEIGKWKITKTLYKGTVDYSKIPELDGIDLDQYRKPSKEVWRISGKD